LSVGKATGQFDNLGNPAPVFFVLNFDSQIHAGKLSHRLRAVQWEPATAK
jgi:hypothetical protein